MIALEGADLHIDVDLHNMFTKAGLGVGGLRAECIVQTPDVAYGLGGHCPGLLATHSRSRSSIRRGWHEHVAPAVGRRAYTIGGYLHH
jgi:hypothetical protein